MAMDVSMSASAAVASAAWSQQMRAQAFMAEAAVAEGQLGAQMEALLAAHVDKIRALLHRHHLHQDQQQQQQEEERGEAAEATVEGRSVEAAVMAAEWARSKAVQALIASSPSSSSSSSSSVAGVAVQRCAAVQRAVAVVVRALRGARVRAEQRRRRRGAMVLREMLETERQYAAHLRLADSAYASALLSAHLLSAVDIHALFGPLRALLPLSAALQTALEEAQRQHASSAVSDPSGVSGWARAVSAAFVSLAPMLKLYAQHVRAHDAAERLLTRLEQQPKAVQVMAAAALASDPPAQPLRSYLIMPVQRVPRYVLLLDALLQATPTATVPRDHAVLADALAAVKAAAAFLNAARQRAEDDARLLRWQRRLTPAHDASTATLATATASSTAPSHSPDQRLLAPHRRYVAEARLALDAEEGRRSTPSRQEHQGALIALLLSDALLLVEERVHDSPDWRLMAAPQHQDEASEEEATHTYTLRHWLALDDYTADLVRRDHRTPYPSLPPASPSSSPHSLRRGGGSGRPGARAQDAVTITVPCASVVASAHRSASV